MNTSGLLQSKWFEANFERDLKYSRFHEQTQNWSIAYIYIFLNIWNIKKTYNLGNKTVLYLICYRINGFVRV